MFSKITKVVTNSSFIDGLIVFGSGFVVGYAGSQIIIYNAKK